MKKSLLSLIAIGCLQFVLSSYAQVPGIINYQGRIVDDGTNFTGTGLFQFALVNPGGTSNYWSNDNTPSGEPTASVSLTVTKGLYSVLLGNTPMTAIPSTVFANSNVLLRVWFNDGVTGFQQLSPDQRLAAVGYALNAAQAQTATVALNVSPTSDVTGQRLDIGTGNNLSGTDATIAGGQNNSAGNNYATVGGGLQNTNSGYIATIAGGYLNTARGNFATVGGGNVNTASNSSATVAGGAGNIASGYIATVGGGFGNLASGPGAFIGGGGTDGSNYHPNTANGAIAAIAGGAGNTATGPGSFIGGGGYDGSTFAGNLASGAASVVGGGLGNTAGGQYSFAAGRQAQALHSGAFVWADSTGSNFASTANNQFLIQAAGGVGIGTNAPVSALHVNGTVTANSVVGRFTGDASGLTNFNSAQLSGNIQPPASVTPIVDMIWIKPGTFIMGSPASEADRSSDESPQTIVMLTRGFWMGHHPVTQGEYLSVMNANPSGFTGDLNLPVETVGWYDATNYCGTLTQRERSLGRLPTGWVYRLPTEAEWEYTCRAWTTTRLYYGNDLTYSSLTNYAWYTSNSGSSTHPVGQLLPNSWGLVDMIGNVWVWCQDWYGAYPGGNVSDPQGASTGSARVMRGGSWNHDGPWYRSAKRQSNTISNVAYNIGFRVVLAPQ